uniref:Basic tail secreted protein n=1 Tax=Rhipicephalus zambeziensis TaxID=60191 RepID=A0A224YAR4_9ACAR
MWIINNIFAVSFMLTGNLCAVQRYPVTSTFGTSQPQKPNQSFPRCDDILRADYPRTSCYYKCYFSKQGLQKGTHSDGTRCASDKFPGRWGHCMRGVCISTEDELPKFNFTKPKQPCYDKYRGKGYAPSCQHTCMHFGKHKQVNYIAGTPCVVLDEYRDRVNAVGICLRGICTPIYKLESRHRNIRKKVFAKQYHRCQEKEHYGRNMLQDCHYFCKLGDDWYYGFYKSTYNSACQAFTPQRMSGYCCKGECIPKANCEGNIGDIPAAINPAGEKLSTL